MQHESLFKRLPTDGWGYVWTGDADRGTDWRQPGGWIYNVLPYVEQQALHDMGAGLPDPQKFAAHTERFKVPLSLLYCPSRRRAVAYPCGWSGAAGSYSAPTNANSPGVVGRSDYAANGGDNYTSAGVWTIPGNPPKTQNTNPPAWTPNPSSWQAGPANSTTVENPPGAMTPGARTTFGYIAQAANGVMYCGSLTKMADITDGASMTYLAGEKYLAPDYYTSGQDAGDNEAALIGENEDIARWTYHTDWPSPGAPVGPSRFARLGRSLRLRQPARQWLQHGFL